MELSTETASKFLEAAGFRVERIAASNKQGEKRADLRAWYGVEEYLIEAKSRDLGDEIKALHADAEKGGSAYMTRTADRLNSVSRSLLNAGRQLASTPAGSNAFRVIWVFAGHHDAKHELSLVHTRLHGKARSQRIAASTWGMRRKSFGW